MPSDSWETSWCPSPSTRGSRDRWARRFLIDIGLLALFAVQHSVMARPAFKRLMDALVPPAAERSTYVLASSLALILLFWQWRPLGGAVWEVEHPVGRGRAVRRLRRRLAARPRHHVPHQPLRPVRAPAGVAALPRTAVPTVAVRDSDPYRIVRHPLYVGWLLAFWARPR